ncbi:MAG TPA: hypothetical protein EYP65_06690 [Armatimonadetes bacterium]|nr:hypothetical protein [Armatimonadota bacterium]
MELTERLKMVDEIRNRLGVSYEEAVEALEEADWDLVRALAVAERKKRAREGLVGAVVRLLDTVKEVLEREGRGKLRLVVGDSVVAEEPVDLGSPASKILAVVSEVLRRIRIEVEEEPQGAQKEEA